jgi:hypothetical protein
MLTRRAFAAAVLLAAWTIAIPVAAQTRSSVTTADDRVASAAASPPVAPTATPEAASHATPATTATPARQPTPKQSDDATDAGSPPLPVDLNHIRGEVDHLPAVKLDENQLRFYTLVLAKQPTSKDFIGDYDLKNGPTKGGEAMTHQEFVDMVTPKELNQLLGGTNGGALMMLQWAAVNAAGQSLIKKAIQDLRGARDDREVQAIRERIDQELQALLGKDAKSPTDQIR